MQARAPALLLLVSSLLFSGAASAAEFIRLGDLPDGLFRSEAFGMSADGEVVVGKASSGANEPFRWTEAGGMIGLGDLANLSITIGEGLGASADGSVVVGDAISDAASGLEAFRWEDDVMVGLGFLPMGDLDSIALDVSADGSVVVGKATPARESPGEAFRWGVADDCPGPAKPGGEEIPCMLGLGDLSGGNFNSRAVAVSADGEVVVGFSTITGGIDTFRWEANDMVGLGVLPGGSPFLSEARGISADGEVIVGFATSHESGEDTVECVPEREPPKAEAYRYVDGVMLGLGDLAGGCFDGLALDASADGSIIVGRSNSEFGDEAFIWDAQSGMRSLYDVLVNNLELAEVEDWQLLEARAVSDDGLSITGTGINPTGETEAWLVRLPEPAAPLLPLAALLIVSALARRRG